MRTIKFNFYNTRTKKYTKWGDSDTSLRLTAFETHEHIKFLQYTGLKDKNGTEIYKGDNVEEDEQLSVCDWIDEVAAFAFVPVEIYPDKEFSAIFENFALDTFFKNDMPSEYVKVIGNVYQNPDLVNS